MFRSWSRKDIIIYLSLLLIISFQIFFLSRLFNTSLLHPTGIDDSNITFTYAHNIANGDGFVYTPNFERVEGATSLLWTLLCSLAFLITSHPEFIIFLACIITTFLTCLVTIKIISVVTQNYSDSEQNYSLFFTILWLATIPAFYAWNLMTLMDLTLWSFFIVITVLVLCDDIMTDGKKSISVWLLSIIGILITVVRPESMAFFPIVIVTAMLCRWKQTNQMKSIFRYLFPAITFLFSELILLTFRLLYFGYPLPNTYYAKVSNDTWYNILQGLKYITTFYLMNGTLYMLMSFVCVFVIALFLIDSIKHPLKKKISKLSNCKICLFAISMITLSGFLFPLVGGGDHFGSFRFMQPFVPLLAIPSISLLVQKVRITLPKINSINRPLLISGVVGSVILLMGFQLMTYRKQHDLKHEFSIAQRGRTHAKIWNQVSHTHGDTSVGVITTGGFGYLFKGRTVDLLGLNWVAMGHSEGNRFGEKNHASFNIKTFWKKPPDVVFDNNCDTSIIRENPPLFIKKLVTRPHFNIYLKGLPTSSQFISHYLPVEISAGNSSVKGYVSREWISQHKSSSIRIIGWTQTKKQDSKNESMVITRN